MEEFQNLGAPSCDLNGIKLFVRPIPNRWGTVVIFRCYDFDDYSSPETLQKMAKCANAALKQGLSTLPRKVLELGLDCVKIKEGANPIKIKWRIIWVLDAREDELEEVKEETKTCDINIALSTWNNKKDIPTANPDTIHLFRAQMHTENEEVPVVVKGHIYFNISHDPIELEKASKCLNTALAQAKGQYFTIYHAMESLDEDLRSGILKHRQDLDLSTFLAQTANALTFIHAIGIAHGDIKPENIFLSTTGDFKLGDFGSVFIRGKGFRTSLVQGTFTYMSPEQYRSYATGEESEFNPFKDDIYALGLTAICLASGKPFNQRPGAAEVTEIIKGLECDRNTQNILSDMTNADENRRISAQELYARLGHEGALSPKLPILREEDRARSSESAQTSPHLEHEQSPFHEIPEEQISLFRGQLDSRRIVLRQHRFENNNGKAIQQHLRAVLSQTDYPVQHPYVAQQITFELSGDNYVFSYVLNANLPEGRTDFTREEIGIFLLPDLEEAPKWIKHIAQHYDRDDVPFATSAGAKYYRGADDTGKKILKKYKFKKLAKEETQKSISHCLSVGLAQALHPGCCSLLDILIRFKRKYCVIYHVLDLLPSDVGSDIEKRKKSSRPYTEEELIDFIKQTSNALNESRMRGIAHGNLQPRSIYHDETVYKFLDLGSYLMTTESGESAQVYKSPQLRQHELDELFHYNAMKADVFSLGAIVLTMATLNPPNVLLEEENLDEKVDKAVAALNYSEIIAEILKNMLSFSEENRADSSNIVLILRNVEKGLSTTIEDAESESKHSTLAEEHLTDREHMSKSVPLVIFLKDPPSAKLIGAETIKSNFPREYMPIFVEGNAGKNSLLEHLAGPEASFKCEESDPDGVYMWPWPVQLGEVSVLLLKLRHSGGKSLAYLELRKKIKAAFMALSSIWCVCESDKTKTAETMKTLVQDYTQIEAKCRVKMSKVLVFLRESWFHRATDKIKIESLSSAHPMLFETHYRGTAGSEQDEFCMARFSAQLQSFRTHEPYATSHVHVVQDNFGFRYSTLLRTLLTIANLDLTLDKFLAKVPDLSASPDRLNMQIQALKKPAENAALIKNSAYVLGFRAGPALDTTVLDTLRWTYELDAPVIVLAVMGPPGCGKSTFLDCIAQFCTESAESSSLFTHLHRTKKARVLSHPLLLQGKQLMLIELEDEMGAKALTDPSAQLERAILAIASVVTIIVSNEAEKLSETAIFIRRLAQLHKNYGLRIECVNLLFHDKNQETGANPDYEKTRAKLNAELFSERQVVRIFKKPNFPAVDEPTRSGFLSAFLSACAFEKRNVNGGESNIQSLLTELAVITQDSRKFQDELQMNPDEASWYEDFARNQSLRLKEIAEEIESRDGSCLVRDFEIQVQERFFPQFTNQHTQKGRWVQRRCSSRIEHDVKQHKVRLARLESCDMMIKAYPEERILQFFNEFVAYRHETAWNVDDFTLSIDELKAKLADIKKHFPERREKVDQLIGHLGSEHDSKKYQPVRLHSWHKSGLMTTRNPETDNVTAFLYEHAKELFFLKSTPLTVTMNEAVLQHLSENCTRPTRVILFIGSKATSLAAVTNAFVKRIIPFTLIECPYHPNTHTQILAVNYLPFFSSDSETGIDHVLIICLRMRKKETSIYRDAMLKIAETLIPASSLTCILSDQSDTYTQILLSRLHRTSCVAERKVIIWSSDGRSKDRLTKKQSIAQILPIQDFTAETISSHMEEIQREFEKLSLSDCTALLELISSIPTAVQDGRLS